MNAHLSQDTGDRDDVMAAGRRVRIGAVVVTWIHVDQGRVQAPDPMEELVADLFGDVVAP